MERWRVVKAVKDSLSKLVKLPVRHKIKAPLAGYKDSDNSQSDELTKNKADIIARSEGRTFRGPFGAY